jgi:anaerobic selenocysteine-containing dehydrogenase
VVVREDGTADAEATAALRARLAAARWRLMVAATDRQLYRAGAVSRRRACPLAPGDAARLGLAEGDLVELVGARVPLRAWVALDSAVAPGTVPLDAGGRRVLGVEAGAPIEIRRLG